MHTVILQKAFLAFNYSKWIMLLTFHVDFSHQWINLINYAIKGKNVYSTDEKNNNIRYNFCWEL